MKAKRKRGRNGRKDRDLRHRGVSQWWNTGDNDRHFITFDPTYTDSKELGRLSTYAIS